MHFHLLHEIPLDEKHGGTIAPQSFKAYTPKYILHKVQCIFVTYRRYKGWTDPQFDLFPENAEEITDVWYTLEFRTGYELETRHTPSHLTWLRSGLWMSVPKALCRVDAIYDGKYNI